MTKTRCVNDRRTLRFDTIDDAIHEADRIANADASGRIRQLGNWTPGQCLGHVAAWIEYGYEGYPLKQAPWFIRLFLAWRVKKYMQSGLPTGVRMPGVKAGTYGTEDMPTGEAAARFKTAFLRLRNGEESPYDSPGFGPMSHDDRIALNLRHAELHLSFLDIVDE